MTLKLNGTNSEAAPAYAGDDADTGLQCGTNELKLVTGGTARATVDSSGRVGLDATPTAQFTGHSLFQIGAQASLGANQALSTTGQTYLTHNLYFDTSGNYQVFNTGSANEGSIIQLIDGSIRFRTSAATTGTPSVGERVRIDANGLKFNGDQAAANALDDYEEGTWTPTCASDGNIGSSQYTNTYTKIGRLVTINCDIHALDNITSTNPIKIGGLPFVPSVTSGEYGSTAVHGERVGSSIVVAFLQYLSNEWVIRFRKGVGSNNYDDIDHSDLNHASDNNMRFTLTYEIPT